MSRRSPEVLVSYLSSFFVAAIFVYLTAATTSYIFLVFAALFVIAGVLYLRLNRIGNVLGVILSVVVIVLFASDIQSGLTGFADLSLFLEVILVVPALILIIAYSALGLAMRSRQRPAIGNRGTFPMSSVIALLTVGFVVGSIFVAVLANGAVLAVGSSSGTSANVTIVVGAANTGVAAPFSPANYTIAVGGTVTWVNRDTVAHTVTSTSIPAGAAPFNSGDIQYGNTFSVTFTVPGTYEYHCSIHPWMTGSIIVTS